jgi:hypothetical protein
MEHRNSLGDADWFRRDGESAADDDRSIRSVSICCASWWRRASRLMINIFMLS